MNYNLLMENWRKFLKEYERRPGEFTKRYPDYDTPIYDDASPESKFVGPPMPDDYYKDEETDIYGPPLPYGFGPMGMNEHVKNAIEELELWGGRKQADPKMRGRLMQYMENLKGICPYWKGLYNYAKSGGFTRNPRNIKVKAYWSAAFIQWCFRNDEKFRSMAGGNRCGDSHKRYHLAARANFRKLLKGDNLEPDDWIHFSRQEAKKIDYQMTPGDICLKGNFQTGFLHGDIVVSYNGDSIGGNLSNTVKKRNYKPNSHMSQRPEVKEKVRRAYNLPK